MGYISVQQALDKKRGTVALRGWVYRESKLKDKIFIVLRDSTNIVQCVIKKNKVTEKEWVAASKLLIESSVVLEGSLKEDKRAPTGYEVEVSKLQVISYAEPFPITKEINEALLLDRRHLWIRSRKMTAILKIRSTVFGAIHEFFRARGFYEFQSPIIIPGGAEEGPTLFEIKYFDKKAYLTQTWQLYAESAIFALEKIYTIAPSFRAEKSKTARHLTEYWHAEMELPWVDLNGLIDYAEKLIRHIVKRVLENNQKEMEILNRDVKKLKPILTKSFARITYDDALKLLKKNFNIAIPWGKDLRTIEEDKLSRLFDTPVFVTHYPKEIMAFYKPRDPKNPRVALCFDLIGPEGHGELIGGSIRDLDIEELKRSLKSKGEKIEDYSYYLDTRRYGSVPHGGFGMGVERVVKWLCDLATIKDAIAFPRTPERFRP
ncbi:MAG: asparagine--tRNA ligase [Candidatus Pacearchaeota archaeon]|nr:asparagine--tRNA ligase [Candidatus Pacearchaeota archaeon]